MTIVYRIENPDGTGPYRGSNSKVNGIALGSVSLNRHQSPREDALFHAAVDRICEAEEVHREIGWELLYIDKIFGFASKEQLTNWFYQWALIEMAEEGAVIAEYHVKKSDIILGENQIIFRNKNKRKTQYDIIEYLKLREMRIENIRETEEPESDSEQAQDRGFALAA